MMTESQKKVIGYIESNTNAVFRGRTKNDARIFISENIDNSKRKRNDSPYSSAIERSNMRIEATNQKEFMDAILPRHGIYFADAYDDDDDIRPW